MKHTTCIKYTTKAISVYKLLYYAETFGVRKQAFDCGAGGSNPPLYIFYYHGYQVSGIDIDAEAVKEAALFCEKNACKLNICLGDMRNIAGASNRYGCCYSYNSIFHMRKPDIQKSIEAMIRITEPGGVLYFNLLHKNDCGYGKGYEIGPGTFEDETDGEIHSYYDEHEIDQSIAGCELVEKVLLNSKRKTEQEILDQWFIEYYMRKKV